MHNRHNSEGPPCAHMEKMLQEVADGTARGWKRWYAVSHAARCFRCGNFLDRMKATLLAIRSAKSPVPNDALERLKAGKWRSEIDSSEKSS